MAAKPPAPTLPPKGVLTPDQIAQMLAFLDANYFRLYDGRSYILVRGENVALGRREWRTSTVGAFREGFRGYDVPTTAGTAGVTDLWLKRAPVFRELTFDPKGPTPGHVFNMWQGLAVEPAEGDWMRLKDHLYEIVCAANDDLFGFLMGWMARLVQQPWDPAGVAIVLRGKQGVGKGPLWSALAKIFGNHAVHVSHASALSSRFNGMLAGCVFLHADEVVWGGDIVGANYLKALMTEPTIGIERKGHEVIQVKNCLHFAMNSNEDHVARVEGGDRRYAVLDVKDTHKGHNKSYFDPLWRTVMNGAPAALLYDLLAHDLSNFDPFVPPETAAHLEQQMRALSPAAAWLVECAMDGEISGVPFGRELTAGAIYESYVKAMANRAMSRRSGETELGFLLNKTMPAMYRQRRINPASGRREWFCLLPELPTARKLISEGLNVPIAWPADD
jgi:hypothetical protein